MKKIISILLCAFLCIGTCASLVACGGEGDSTLTVIKYVIGDGGFGKRHADDLAEQFEKWASDNNKIYAEGKTGVDVEVHVEPETNIKNAKGQGYHVMNVSADGDSVARLATLGYLANVNDVVTGNMDEFEFRDGKSITIEEKIPEYARGSFQAKPVNGVREYYLVPGYSYAPGFTFDENAFNKYGYFFADAEAENSDKYFFDSNLMNERYYFLKGTDLVYEEPEGKKSAGPDQEYGTQDDGLPSSIIELAVLCEKIKSDDRYPFIVAGAYSEYQQFFTQALYIQLMGYDQIRTWMNFDGGPLEIVTGYTNDPLFPGYPKELAEKGTQIYKPTTAIVNLTEENGYYASMSYAKYIATAFTQLAFDMDWFHENVFVTTRDQKAAMRDFVLSGHAPAIKESMMLIEMNFWYNEAKLADIHDEFTNFFNDDGHLDERRMTWMSLPTVFEGYTEKQIQEGRKTRQVLYGTDSNGLGIASYIQDDPELLAACKDFLRFYCTDYQMNRWTAEIGIRKTADYKIDENVLKDMPWYARKLGELMNTNIDPIICYAENETFKNNFDDYVCGYHGSPIKADIKDVHFKYVTDYFKNVDGATVKAFFDAGVLTPELWVGKYYGNKEVAGYSKDSNDVEIKFNPVIPQ